jgi:hypothetical protein
MNKSFSYNEKGDGQFQIALMTKKNEVRLFLTKPSNLELHYTVFDRALDCVRVTKTEMDTYHSNHEMLSIILEDGMDGYGFL